MVREIIVIERLTNFVSSEDLGQKKQSLKNHSSKYSQVKKSELKEKSSHKGSTSKGKAPKPDGCFLYGGSHMVRECS